MPLGIYPTIDRKFVIRKGMILASIAPVEVTPREGENLQDGNYKSQDKAVMIDEKIEFLTNLELYVINGLHNHIICGLDFLTLTRYK